MKEKIGNVTGMILIYLNTRKEREIEKTDWMNENVAKVIITKDMYSRKADTDQYLSPNYFQPKNQAKNILLGVADRMQMF